MTYIIIIILIAFSALFSGLTLGLMGLSSHELKRKAELGDADARAVYPVRKRGNLLLTTLLIGNVAVNAALSIYLGSIASGVVAGLIATALIVVFGEIIPQAVFSRFALALGARFAPVVRLLMFVIYPIAKPIAVALDAVLGSDLPTIYSKQELAKIIEEHGETEMSEVDADEERIVTGALTFSDKTVADVMTPRQVVKHFDASRVVDNELFREVSEAGHSRFPIIDGDVDSVVGILYAKHLIGDDKEDMTVGEVMVNDVQEVDERASLDDMLNTFLKTHKHMAIVRDEFGGFSGVITLEDVIEEILRKEIVDETDQHEDMREFARQCNRHDG